jgi:DNA-binding transcriptional LysR family regulator
MAITLDDIKYFLKTAETLNVTRASEQLGITQPTLSYAIKRLESELKSDLIIRLKNGIQLTKLGEEFLTKARMLLVQWSEVEALVNPDEVDFRGEYKIAIHPSVGLYCVDKFLPQILKKYPHINIKFIHGLSREMTEKVISWEADFGIVVNPIEHPDLIIKELYRDTVTVFGVKKCKNKLILDKDLNQTQFILKKVSSILTIDEYISTGSLELVYKLASLGLGYAILPATLASQNSALKRIEKAPKFEDKICLVYRREKLKNTVGRELLKLLNQIK